MARGGGWDVCKVQKWINSRTISGESGDNWFIIRKASSSPLWKRIPNIQNLIVIVIRKAECRRYSLDLPLISAESGESLKQPFRNGWNDFSLAIRRIREDGSAGKQR